MNEKIVIKGIDEQKLKDIGFVETQYGFKKDIPNCFRFRWCLYITADDIYGTVEGKMGSDETKDYEDWLDRLSFRNPEKVPEVKELIQKLIDSGAIILHQ